MTALSARVPNHQLLAFALPSIPVAMVLGPLNNILPAYYAQHTAVTLSAIGTILLLTRITDAIADQVIGYLSDATRSRMGRRKPWILAGALILSVAGYALYTPSADSDAAYFFWSVLSMYLGFSMMMVPLQAWSSELSRAYVERARINTFTGVALGIGGVAVYATPLLPMFQTTEFSAESLQFIAVLFLVALPVTAVIAAALVPQGAAVSTRESTLRGMLKAVVGNKPFWWFLAMMVLAAIALGIVNILLFMYLTKVLGLAARIPHLFLTSTVVGLVTTPLWLSVIRRIGKHRSLVLSGVLTLLLLPALWFFQPGDFWPCLVWMVCLAITAGAGRIAPLSILGDIVDYDTLKTGANHAGNYFAFVGLMQKSIGAVGGALAFFMLDWIGFDPKADAVSAGARFDLLLSMTVTTALLTIPSLWLNWRFPLDARRHDIIRRRLEQRCARELRGATDEGTTRAAPAAA